MVTQIWTLQICIVLFRFKFNLKFCVKFINEQYKVFKFNIILKIYIFHLTCSCNGQFRSLSETIFDTHLVSKYK